MHLIVLHGPPAVGKLTIANHLAALTGYKVFHNHLTVDLVTSLFPFGSRNFGRLVMQFRYDMLGAAAQSEIVGVIHTFVYAHELDDDIVRRLIETVEPHGGTVSLVLLTADPEVLLARVGNADRAAHGKLRDPEILRSLLEREDLMAPFPDRPGLVFDTTHRAPEAVAAEIATALGLGLGTTP